MTDRTRDIPRPQGPPVCPKCGSHRTQIIGTFDDANTLNIRCGSCGEVSTVPAPGADSRSHTRTRDVAECYEEELLQQVAVAVPR